LVLVLVLLAEIFCPTVADWAPWVVPPSVVLSATKSANNNHNKFRLCNASTAKGREIRGLYYGFR
jgi:hypothetical protein